MLEPALPELPESARSRFGGVRVNNSPTPDEGGFGEFDARFTAAVERGRWRWALPRAAVVVAVAAPAVVAGATVLQAALLGMVLAAVAAFAGWRSRAGLVGAFAGVAVAIVPLIVGPLLMGRCHCTGGLCLSWCGLGCGASAAVIGIAAGWAFSRVSGPPAWRVDFAAAAVVCSAIGMLLCPVTGVGSVAGAVIGAVVGFSPALVWRVARPA